MRRLKGLAIFWTLVLSVCLPWHGYAEPDEGKPQEGVVDQAAAPADDTSAAEQAHLPEDVAKALVEKLRRLRTMRASIQVVEENLAAADLEAKKPPSIKWADLKELESREQARLAVGKAQIAHDQIAERVKRMRENLAIAEETLRELQGNPDEAGFARSVDTLKTSLARLEERLSGLTRDLRNANAIQWDRVRAFDDTPENLARRAAARETRETAQRAGASRAREILEEKKARVKKEREALAAEQEKTLEKVRFFHPDATFDAKGNLVNGEGHRIDANMNLVGRDGKPVKRLGRLRTVVNECRRAFKKWKLGWVGFGLVTLTSGTAALALNPAIQVPTHTTETLTPPVTDEKPERTAEPVKHGEGLAAYRQSLGPAIIAALASLTNRDHWVDIDASDSRSPEDYLGQALNPSFADPKLANQPDIKALAAIYQWKPQINQKPTGNRAHVTSINFGTERDIPQFDGQLRILKKKPVDELMTFEVNLGMMPVTLITDTAGKFAKSDQPHKALRLYLGVLNEKGAIYLGQAGMKDLSVLRKKDGGGVEAVPMTEWLTKLYDGIEVTPPGKDDPNGPYVVRRQPGQRGNVPALRLMTEEEKKASGLEIEKRYFTEIESTTTRPQPGAAPTSNAAPGAAAAVMAPLGALSAPATDPKASDDPPIEDDPVDN